ncbi:MAG: hypothetical protein IH991_05070 [Planctomycetes bacterium]|nr:hypothetical protein [Planctomycetota bacterium]
MNKMFRQMRLISCAVVIACIATTGCISPKKHLGGAGSQLSALHDSIPEPVYDRNNSRYHGYSPISASNNRPASRTVLSRFGAGSC